MDPRSAMLSSRAIIIDMLHLMSFCAERPVRRPEHGQALLVVRWTAVMPWLGCDRGAAGSCHCCVLGLLVHLGLH